jgi:hypothetical protein
MERRELPPSGVLSHVGASRNPNGREIKHLFREFGVANYPAYRAGVLGVEDDDGVMLLLVMRGMVPDAVAEVGIELRHEQVLDWKFGNVVALGSIGHLFELLKRHRSLFRRDFQTAVMLAGSRLRGSEKPVYFLSARAPISRAKLRLMIGAAINARWCSLFWEKWLHLCPPSRVAELRTFCIMLRYGIAQFVGSGISESGYHLRIKKVRKGRASVGLSGLP